MRWLFASHQSMGFFEAFSWRKRYGGMEVSDAKRLKALEQIQINRSRSRRRRRGFGTRQE